MATKTQVVVHIAPVEYFAQHANAQPTTLENVYILPDTGEVVILRFDHCLVMTA